jgi:nicotinamidase-related amidase
VAWVYWHNRADLRDLGAPTVYAFKHTPGQKGSGEPLGRGRVLTEDSWNAEVVGELKPLMRDEDVGIEKVRMNGFVGTHLDQVLRTQGIATLYFAASTSTSASRPTMEEACFRGFTTTTEQFAAARPVRG